MKPRISRATTVTAGIWSVFIVASAILLIFISTLFWNAVHISNMSTAVQKNESIENELHELEEDLLNAETGQRGYLLSHDRQYLQPYLASFDLIPNRIKRLKNLITDTEPLNNLNHMTPVITAKMDELALTVALANKGQWDAALAVVRAGQGKQLMDKFRRINASIINFEQRQRAERRIRFMATLQGITLSVVIGSILSLVLLFVFSRQMAKRLKQPINNLLEGIQTLSDGQPNYRISVSSMDEIGRITAAFNDMAENVEATQRQRDASMAELKHANAELDSFAYVASHDLKAPLRGIRNLAEWVEEDVRATATEETRDNLRLLSTRVNRLDSLLESLLAYSRIGRKNDAAELVNTGKLVREIGDYLAKPDFIITCPDEMPIFFTAKAPLELVLRNLINNAIKHHDLANGRIRITAIDRGERVEFRVSDDGPGIPPEFHGRIFEMFQTLKPRDAVEGSGMGLAIVLKTVEFFGGQMRVESSTSTRGTTFVFTWLKQVKN